MMRGIVCGLLAVGLAVLGGAAELPKGSDLTPAQVAALAAQVGKTTKVQWVAEEFLAISGPASPRVAYGIARTGTELDLALQVEMLAPGEKDEKIQLGLAAAKTVTLTEKAIFARWCPRPGVRQYLFRVPAASLVKSPADWATLRFAVVVEWPGGPFGEARQRERFRHLNSGAAHDGLSPNPADWAPLDLDEYRRTVQDRINRLAVAFTQPMDGKATIVIEDEKGRRVRNLVAGVPFAKGPRQVAWDGLDEAGNVVKPGKYTWRAISHPGITPEFLFSFCNDPGPNHSCLVAATTNGQYTFFGAPVTEGGYALMALDAQGKERMHYTPVMGTGIERVALAADDTYLYVAHDGVPWGKDSDARITLTRFNITGGGVADFPQGKRFLEITKPQANAKGLSLAGLAYLEGKLYVASRTANALLVLDPKTGVQTGELKLDAPGGLTTAGGQLYAISGSSIVRVSPTGETATVVPAGQLDPRGIAVDQEGAVYASDGASHTVKVFSAQGALLRTIGSTPGGPYKGAYNPQRLVHPRGLAFAPDGKLWITEERWTPKRYAAWDPATGKVLQEHFGPTAYGAGSGGYDAADQSRWIGLGTQWELDMAKKTAVPRSILGSHFGAMHYSYVHQDGRTFLIGFGGFTSISELLADGSVKDLAFIGSTHRFCFALDWNPPQTFIDAFNTAYPGRAGKHSDKGPGVLWVDRNGDGELQAEEYDFSTTSENFAGAYWGNDFHDLTLVVPATVKGKRVLVTLKPQGYYPGGAPKYPALNDACAAGVPVDLATNEVETTVDRFGNVICNSDPAMTSFAPDGTLRWTYPNRWTNVHGSHNAPLPEVGVMQGALFFLGTAPFDDKADVFMMNGNHGRFFVLTSDGYYLDEMFKDVRLGGQWDVYTIGGECFGGFFGKSQKDGNYYLQSGSIEYRVFRINGLAQAKRSAGTVIVTPQQAAAAERELGRKVASVAEKKTAVISAVTTPPTIDGKDNDWPADVTVRWDKSGQFPVRVRAAYDTANLYLYYQVNDPSPWVNNGKDWTLLFKTGDSVDLQLGANPAANPLRTGPVPGDLRLLIAPLQGQPVAVLYRHRLPAKDNPVTFTSPWRSEVVDSVRQLPEAKIIVTKDNAQYRVEAAIPLASLGLTAITGKVLKADFGALFGDDDGQYTMLRSYWSNQVTNLVNDVPGEIMLSPNLWGTVEFN